MQKNLGCAMKDGLVMIFVRRHKKAVIVASSTLFVLLCAAFAPHLFFRSMSYQRHQFQQELGVELPTRSTDFHSAQTWTSDGSEYWAAAQISHDDFLKLAHALHLSQDAATLDYFPSALYGPNESGWWCRKTEADGETWITRMPDGFIVITYEDGRFFLHRSRYQ